MPLTPCSTVQFAVGARLEEWKVERPKRKISLWPEGIMYKFPKKEVTEWAPGPRWEVLLISAPSPVTWVEARGLKGCERRFRKRGSPVRFAGSTIIISL